MPIENRSFVGRQTIRNMRLKKIRKIEKMELEMAVYRDVCRDTLSCD